MENKKLRNPHYQSPYEYKTGTSDLCDTDGRPIALERQMLRRQGGRPRGVEISVLSVKAFLGMLPAQKRSVSAYSGCDLNTIVGSAHGKRVSAERKKLIEEAIDMTINVGLHPEVAKEEALRKTCASYYKSNNYKCSRSCAQKLADKLVSMAGDGEIPSSIIYWLAYECKWGKK